MYLILYRSIVFFFEGFCGPLTALAVFGMKPWDSWRRAAICGIIISVISNACYAIPFEAPRHVIHWVVMLIACRILFSATWWQAVKLFVTWFIFVIPPEIFGWMAIGAIIGHPGVTDAEFYKVAVPVMPPLYLLMVWAGAGLNHLTGRWAYLLVRIQTQKQVLLLFGLLLLQSVLLFFCLDESSPGPDLHPLKIALWLIWMIIMMLNIFIVYRIMKVHEENFMREAQETISTSIENLINAVRTQRHDFCNHLQVISGLNQTGQQQELQDYLAELNTEVSFYNQLFQIDNPAVSALLNGKMTIADAKQVRIIPRVNANLSSYRRDILELVRILGNLLDNAIEAVENHNPENRWVEFQINERGDSLVFEVCNPGSMNIDAQGIFPGTTTKGSSHAGLGLYSAQQLAQKAGGRLEIDSQNDLVKITLVVPK